MNQGGGFDCPGCAWPEPADRGMVEFCENGAKAVAAEATGKRVTPQFFETYSVAELLEKTDHWLEAQGRLTEPMHLAPGATHYRPISWAHAFERLGASLRGLSNPDRAVFYTSGRTSNEAAFLWQLFVREFGTNNLPDCSNLCHESSGVGLTEAIGIGKGTVQLDDFEKAEAIFVIGQNPGTNHPRMLLTLQAAARRGAKIVSINPLRERALEAFAHPKEVVRSLLGKSTAISSLYLQPKPGSDVALLQGMAKHVLAAGAVDRAFVEAHTTGFEAFRSHLEGVSWERIERETGLAEGEIRKASDVYAASKATIFCWAMGLTQHPHGVDNVQACVNLLLLRGNLGRPGAGACPVRGHSNVQGDRTVGVTPKPRPAFAEAIARQFGFEPPRAPGLDTVEAIRAMHAGKVDVFVGLGGNFQAASPDTVYTTEALRRCRVTAHVSTKLNRSHLVTGAEAFILPCLGRSEVDLQEGVPQFVTVEDSMGCVHSSRGARRPPGERCLSEPAFVAGLATATLGERSKVDWERLAGDYDRIRDAIEAVLPELFRDYNRRIREPGGFVLPNTARERTWRTASGKAQFTAVPTPDIHIPDGWLRLFTIRSHDQFNTTIYGLDDRYRGVQGERRVLFMNARDLAALGLEGGALVDVHGPSDEGRERVVHAFRAVEYDVPAGCVAAYFPETNPLIPHTRTAARSNTPASKLVEVRVEPSRG